MKLSECTYGRMVIINREVGFIVGLTYNVSIFHAAELNDEERFNCTIPLVRFPQGERGVYPSNLKPFNG